MIRRSLAVVALSLGASGADASSFRAINGFAVEAVSATAFHVPYSRDSEARQFWCAAADYAEKRLRLPPATRIYRASEPPRRSGEGITFTLDPEKAASSTGTLKFGGPKAAYRLSHARLFCNDVFFGNRRGG